MKYQQLKKKTEGFTIIEVLIVLAIAGLILLIVFLAVPALQRNSRNTQIRNDAANVLGGVSDFSNNNNGRLPTTIAVTGNTVTFSGASGTTPSEAKVKSGTVVVESTSMPALTQFGRIHVAFGSGCNSTNNDFAVKPRAFAAGYNVEANSGANGAPQCTES